MDPAFYPILFKAQVPQIGVLRLWLNVESWIILQHKIYGAVWATWAIHAPHAFYKLRYTVEVLATL
jgi:hypothetical protein